MRKLPIYNEKDNINNSTLKKSEKYNVIMLV